MNYPRPKTKKRRLKSLEHMERVDVLLMKLHFELDFLEKASRLEVPETLARYCEAEAYPHVAAVLRFFYTQEKPTRYEDQPINI